MVYLGVGRLIIPHCISVDLPSLLQTSATDLQTKADRLVQMSICSSLSRKFPKLTIIGEEVRGAVQIHTNLPLSRTPWLVLAVVLVFEHKVIMFPREKNPTS